VVFEQAGDLEAVHARHHQVKDDDVGGVSTRSARIRKPIDGSRQRIKHNVPGTNLLGAFDTCGQIV
jgi:hypothetical protein